MEKHLKSLGQKTKAFSSPEETIIETVTNPHPGESYVVRFTCPEFTSLCPVTGQPDFAHLVIDYIPDTLLIESKSLKLYLGSFRNHGAFHEDCTISIAKCLITAAKPQWLRMAGYWYPRGGIPIDIFFQNGPTPVNVWIPETGVLPYRGRG
jgi:7-cyano-7-deazaguanine reductase